MQEDALTADDVAAMLRVSRNTVYNLVKRDQLASYHVGRKMRFTRADVENYIARGVSVASGSPLGAVDMQDGFAAPAASPAVSYAMPSASPATPAASSSAPVGGARVHPSAVLPGTARTHSPAATGAAGGDATPAQTGSRPYGQRDPTSYVIAGNDMIGDVLANYLGSLGHTVARRYEDSYAALTHLYLGDVDAALVHLFDALTGTYNIEYVQRLVPGAPVRLVRLVSRQQGFIVARGNPKRIFSWRDLLRDDVRLINRELGSGSRVLLDEEMRMLDAPRDTSRGAAHDVPRGASRDAAHDALRGADGRRVPNGDVPTRGMPIPGTDGRLDRIRGYGDVATSALSMASYIERGAADVGVGAERVAKQVEGVDFVPLREEHLDVALSLRPGAREASEAVAQLVRTRALRDEVAALTGCDTSHMGTVLL